MAELSPIQKTYYEDELIGDQPSNGKLSPTKIDFTPTDVAKNRKLANAVKLAREYVKDYHLACAALRLDMDIDDATDIYHSPEFARAMRMCIELIAPEDVTSSREILQAYKEIAFGVGYKAAERLAALDRLNKFAVGLKPLDGLDEEGTNNKNTPPTINITFNGPTPAPSEPKPAVRINQHDGA